MKTTAMAFLLCSLLLSCKKDLGEVGDGGDVKPLYVLPYPVGQAYFCAQGFNFSYSHYDSFKYSVDFEMPIGTIVTAARAGRVVYIVETYADNDETEGHENVVIVMHEDSTYARYAHLKTNGALVDRNQVMKAGDTVGLSGNTGTNAPAHLHFDVTATFTGRGDQTIPFDFMNMSPHPFGFHRGDIYVALPF